jgi:hypothetical protein
MLDHGREATLERGAPGPPLRARNRAPARSRRRWRLDPASGSIDWLIASTFTGAAIAGALAGRRLGAIINPRRLGQLFALLLVAIAVVLVAKNAPALL